MDSGCGDWAAEVIPTEFGVEAEEAGLADPDRLQGEGLTLGTDRDDPNVWDVLRRPTEDIWLVADSIYL